MQERKKVSAWLGSAVTKKLVIETIVLLLLMFGATAATNVSAYSNTNNVLLTSSDGYANYSSEAFYNAGMTVTSNDGSCDSCYTQQFNVWGANGYVRIQAVIYVRANQNIQFLLEIWPSSGDTYSAASGQLCSPTIYLVCADSGYSSNNILVNGGYLKAGLDFSAANQLTGVYFVIWDYTGTLQVSDSYSLTFDHNSNFVAGGTVIVGPAGGYTSSFTATTGYFWYQINSPKTISKTSLTTQTNTGEQSNMDYSSTISGLGTNSVTQNFCSTDKAPC